MHHLGDFFLKKRIIYMSNDEFELCVSKNTLPNGIIHTPAYNDWYIVDKLGTGTSEPHHCYRNPSLEQLKKLSLCAPTDGRNGHPMINITDINLPKTAETKMMQLLHCLTNDIVTFKEKIKKELETTVKDWLDLYRFDVEENLFRVTNMEWTRCNTDIFTLRTGTIVDALNNKVVGDMIKGRSCTIKAGKVYLTNVTHEFVQKLGVHLFANPTLSGRFLEFHKQSAEFRKLCKCAYEDEYFNQLNSASLRPKRLTWSYGGIRLPPCLEKASASDGALNNYKRMDWSSIVVAASTAAKKSTSSLMTLDFVSRLKLKGFKLNSVKELLELIDYDFKSSKQIKVSSCSSRRHDVFSAGKLKCKCKSNYHCAKSLGYDANKMKDLDFFTPADMAVGRKIVETTYYYMKQRSFFKIWNPVLFISNEEVLKALPSNENQKWKTRSKRKRGK